MHDIRFRGPASPALALLAALVVSLCPAPTPFGDGLALAQAPASVTVTDISFDFASTSYRVPRLEIRGGNLSEADAKALFDKASPVPVGERLSKLSAREIVVPSLIVEQSIGPQRQTTTYRDVTLTGIADGRIASAQSAGGTFEIAGPDKTPKGGFGRFTATDLDIGQMFFVYAAKAGADKADYLTLYGSFSLEDVNVAMPTGAQFRVGRVAAGSLKARPTAQSWTGTLAAITELGGKGPPTEAQQSQIISLTADMLDSFDLASMEMVDIENRPPEGSKEPRIRMARVAYTGAATGRPAEIRLDGIDAQGSDGMVRIASIAFGDFSFQPTLAGMKDLGGRPLTSIAPDELRRYLPNFGTVRVAGIEVDVPSDKEDATAARTRYGLRSVDLSADKPINGVPTGLRIVINNWTMPIGADEKQDGLRELAAMGIRSLDLSSALGAAWNEATSELAIREFSVKGGNLGSVLVRGTLGNVGRDVFDSDTAVASVALLGATLKNLDLTVENTGLGDKIIAQQAAQQRRSPEELRREYGMTAAIGVPAVLGNSPQAKTLGSAIARFIAKPNRLAISARVKDGVGLGAADLGLMGDPNALMNRLDVTATAE